jgi:hypothetical protein
MFEKFSTIVYNITVPYLEEQKFIGTIFFFFFQLTGFF